MANSFSRSELILGNDAMQKLAAIESAVSTLPGLDCGACGAPSCMAFAEDIASGEATMDECVRRDK